MVGVDTKIDGNNAKWIVGAAAGFAKGDMNDRSGQVDQDSQTAYIYSSAHFANNVFVDGSRLLSLQQRPVCNHEQRYLR